jgi:16S rRNA (adenine1518-N6/adenine1519-N6)-dimethyltransferase
VQKEVAERLTAEPGTRQYGTASILLAATGKVRVIRALPPSVFWPPPQVDSALVAFTRDPAKCARVADVELLNQVAHFFIGHRRKMLRSCLKSLPQGWGDRTVWLEALQRCGIDPTRRPAELSCEQYVALANTCLPAGESDRGRA